MANWILESTPITRTLANSKPFLFPFRVRVTVVLLYCIHTCTPEVFQVLLYCISHLKSSISHSCGSTPEEFLIFFFFSVKSCMNSLLPLGVVVQKMDNTIVDRMEWLWSPPDSFVIQGFWYSARSWSREIQVDPGNSQKHAKYCKNSKMWNLSQLLGLSNCRKHANVSWNFITTNCANTVPNLPGANYVVKKWALVMILKASLPLAHFSSVLLLKEQMIISVKKSEKCSSN